MKEFKLASEEALNFNRLIAELFVSQVLGIKDFLITDESSVSDFRPFPEHHVTPQGDKFEFTHTFYRPQEVLAATGRHLWQLSEEERKPFEITSTLLLERAEVSFDADIIAKVQYVFGVTIPTSLLKERIVTVALEISKAINPETRAKLTKKLT